MKVLIIIPAFNEEANIEQTIQKLKAYQKKSRYDIAYLIVNDGSQDRTKQICEEHAFETVHLIHNLGIGGAVQTGYQYAYAHNFDAAVQFDGDGQHDENYIDALLDELEQGYDLVVGSRFIEPLSTFRSSGTRRIGIKILSTLIWLCTHFKIYDPTSGFRAANRKVIALFARSYPLEYPEPETLAELLKHSYTIKEIPVIMHQRVFGTSSIKPWKSLYYMFSVCLAIISIGIWRKGT